MSDEYIPEEHQLRYARAIVRLRVREGAPPPLAILQRAADFHSMSGPLTGPERMDYARAVAWLAEHPEDTDA